uniref:Tyrosine-specific transport protein n=1 Tax=Oryza punctata TaxID=4537 RepID=A0A0E0LPE5_ORYPU
MALTASLRCYPLLSSSASASSVSLPASTRAPVLHRTTGGPRRRLQRCQCSQQYAEKQSSGSQQQQLERLFSNLNQATMKHEPGSVTSSIFLVAGTTVGAGILAIPAVTQEAGFLASAVTCIFCWSYMVVTGLLVAEVNVNTMCELGSGGVSLVSMAMRTLGTFGVRTACQRVIGAVNGFLVFSILASFTTLVVVASGNLQWSSLLEANFSAAPQSIPIIALSFVYQNVVPVLCTNLEGDLSKVRKAIVVGTAIPLALFLIWDAVILGTLPGLAGDGTIIDPLEQLRSSNGTVGPIVEAFSFLAIGTSYIGFVLGLSDFIADFLVLFGVFPAAMSWSERYSDDLEAPVPPIVPGGKVTLSFVMGGALLGLSKFIEIPPAAQCVPSNGNAPNTAGKNKIEKGTKEWELPALSVAKNGRNGEKTSSRRSERGRESATRRTPAMALTASLRCYPLLSSSASASSVSLPASTRAPVLHRTTGGPRRRLQRCQCSQQYAEKQSSGSQQQQLERLFSNLNQATMKHEPGEAQHASLNFLVHTSFAFEMHRNGTVPRLDVRECHQFDLPCGRHNGAGILAIPAVTQEAGFLASAVTCIFCWSYMVVTGLLVAEVNVNTMCELGSGGVSLVSMAMRTLGTFGVRTACILASFTTLVVVASGNLQWSSLLEANFSAAPQSIPIIALSFVYQNVVPVLCTNLEGDLSKVRKAIVVGTAIPLALFLIWDAVILGTLPGLAGDGTIIDPLEQLRSSNGTVGPIVEAFSFLAIGTSYIGFVLGLSDFIADLLKLPSGQNKPLPYLVTLLPPLVLSLLDPEIFFKALDFAGTYGGKDPFILSLIMNRSAMSWSERYSDDLEAPVPPIVPGGKVTLSFVMGGALLVIFSEIFKDIMQLQGLH